MGKDWRGKAKHCCVQTDTGRVTRQQFPFYFMKICHGSAFLWNYRLISVQGFCADLRGRKSHTVRKMDFILRSIERRSQMQFSMVGRFKLQLLRRYSLKFSKMRNFTLETLRLDKLKSTGERRTNIPWIYSPLLYHCATSSTHVLKAEKQESRFRSQHPSAQWNLRGSRWSSAEYCTEQQRKNTPKK